MTDGKCLGCMKPTSGEERCPHCGFSISDPVAEEYLQPNTLLREQYVVGKMIQADGEGITYLGINYKTSEGIFIREYRPSNLCTRKGEVIAMNIGCEAKFKALQSDFIELYQTLASLRNLDNIIHVTDLFRANQTVYAIYQHFEAQQLTQHINENAGELDWNMASGMFKPILESLTKLHKAGLIHRAISPETLLVCDNKLLLTGFSICASRMSDSEIPSTIYPGYAAPEQYSKMMPHGEWTDVYAVSAVLYKVLSGTMPPEAPTRAVNDNLISLTRLNGTVPAGVSNAIEAGMSYDVSKRTQNIEGLMANLYFSKTGGTGLGAKDATAVFSTAALNEALANDAIDAPTQYIDEDEEIDLYSNTKPVDEEDDGEPKKKLSPLQKTLLIAIPFILIGIFLLYWFIIGSGCEKKEEPVEPSTSSQSEEPSSQSESSSKSESSQSESSSSSEPEEDLIKVPNFIKMEYNSVVNSYSNQFTFTSPNYDYSEDVAEGSVMAQNIEAGKEVPEKQTITLTVSKGSRYFEVPKEKDLKNWWADDLKKHFQDAGINASVSDSPSDSVPAGYVCGLQGVLPGSKIDKAANPNITILRSTGPDSIDPDGAE